MRVIFLILGIFIIFYTSANAKDLTFKSTENVQDGIIVQEIYIEDNNLFLEQTYERHCRYDHQIGSKKVRIGLKSIGLVEKHTGHRGTAIFVSPKKRITLFGIKGVLDRDMEAKNCVGGEFVLPNLTDQVIIVDESRADELFEFIQKAIR